MTDDTPPPEVPETPAEDLPDPELPTPETAPEPGDPNGQPV